MRTVVAIVVAVDSPAGQIAAAIDDLSAHLPPTANSATCPLCRAQPWPCPAFDDAARQIVAFGVRLADLVPLDLHSRLWPPPPDPPIPPQEPAAPEPDVDPWFAKEPLDE